MKYEIEVTVLKKIRLENGYTQARIAEMLGVTKQSLWCWENQKVFPNRSTQLLVHFEFLRRGWIEDSVTPSQIFEM
ncbi:hypothetical protein LCGC14_2828750 [marine sediment metagenome]|uniref:HTH cro/C1-type domain-containing protein n=1 Tax=marine sediment metagenome TaxID=412755 RepID=A0A0F8YER6_9ZZZZ